MLTSWKSCSLVLVQLVVDEVEVSDPAHSRHVVNWTRLSDFLGTFHLLAKSSSDHIVAGVFKGFATIRLKKDLD
jgi:hypothetical protein